MAEPVDRRAFLQYAAAVGALPLAGLARTPTAAVAHESAGNRVVAMGRPDGRVHFAGSTRRCGSRK